MGRVVRPGGRRLPVLLGELHGLAQLVDEEPGPRRGLRFERRIADGLAACGFPVRVIPGGVEILGVLAASGLAHQIDAEIPCSDAQVIGEWKAYRAPVPKNEVMLFKAKTDDIYDTLCAVAPHRPVVRIFGMAGDASPALRVYAARHGIGLVERTRWPSAVLADPLMRWPRDSEPSHDDLRRLRYLCRPLQRVHRVVPGVGTVLAPPLSHVTAEALLATHDRWSRRLDQIAGLRREELAA
jgi:hypothetical protein